MWGQTMHEVRLAATAAALLAVALLWGGDSSVHLQHGGRAAVNNVPKHPSACIPGYVWRGEWVVLGLSAFVATGTESAELFAQIWNAFEQRRAEIEPLALDRRYQGVRFPVAGGSEYIAGVAVRPETRAPPGCTRRTIPAGDYAVFACDVAAISWAYGYIMVTWRPTVADRIDDTRPSFEQYPPADEPQGLVLIHIPLKPDAAGPGAMSAPSR